MEVRVRYAPSPTGYLHIGGARSALFNYLFAKKHNGKLIFRSEDTDIERNVAGGEESQYNDLLWLGIVPDESPFNPNPKYAPYRQTERLEIYRKYAQQLLDEGKAYYCYCTEEEVEARKQEQLDNGVKAPKYDGKCRNLTPEEIKKYQEEGRVPCIRIKLTPHKEYRFNDLVRGEMKFSSDDLGGDFVIMKSNGLPTYNFAVVIDDHLMDITHVLRGEEHLSNTPKQLAVYEAFSWVPPEFGHMTIIVNKNGKKLSKRDLNVLQFMSQYREMGYLPEAIVNFILLLGWNGKDNKEIYSLKEAEEAFNEKNLSLAPSTFDEEKMKWMNNYYIKNLSDEKYLEFALPFMSKVLDVDKYSKEELLHIADMFKSEISYGAMLTEGLKKIITPTYDLDEEALSYLNLETSPKVYQSFINALNEAADLSKDSLKAAFKKAMVDSGVKGKNFYMPLRLKLTGSHEGIELYNIIAILGKEETIKRLR